MSLHLTWSATSERYSVAMRLAGWLRQASSPSWGRASCPTRQRQHTRSRGHRSANGTRAPAYIRHPGADHRRHMPTLHAAMYIQIKSVLRQVSPALGFFAPHTPDDIHLRGCAATLILAISSEHPRQNDPPCFPALFDPVLHIATACPWKRPLAEVNRPTCLSLCCSESLYCETRLPAMCCATTLMECLAATWSLHSRRSNATMIVWLNDKRARWPMNLHQNRVTALQSNWGASKLTCG